jgi:hypothetical protein
MATCTLVVTSNADGTMTATSTSAPAITFGPTTSLKAIINWAKGVVFQTLVPGTNIVASD